MRLGRRLTGPGEGRAVGRRVGEPDGFGFFRLVEETADGLLRCAECGWEGRHLGLHAFKGHGRTAAQYKEIHGLRRGQGPVASSIRSAIQDNARTGFEQRTLFVERRKPATATEARLRADRPVSAAAAADRDSRMRLIGLASRRGRVTTCEWCGVEFCALQAAKTRRLCTRSCASKATRARPTSRS